SFSHVGSQTQLPVFGSPRSTPIRGRSTGRNAGTSRATEDCVKGGRLVSRCEVWRRVVWLRPDRQESHLRRAAVRLSMSLRLTAKQRIPGQCRERLGNFQAPQLHGTAVDDEAAGATSRSVDQ